METKENYLERFIRAQLLMGYAMGVYFTLHVLGFTRLQVDAITISPAQAANVQNNLEFDTEVIKPRVRR